MELTTHDKELVAAGGVLGGAISLTLILSLVILVIDIIAWWKIFEKAGLKGWKSLIPIYSQYCLYRISGMSGWWCFFPVIPSMLFSIAGVNLTAENVTFTDTQMGNPLVWIAIILSIVAAIVSIVQVVKIAEGFKKGTGFKIASVFFSPITYLILAFGKDKYNKKFLHD